MIRQMAEYFMNNRTDILIQVRDHITISLLALFIACIIGIPLGYLASKSRRGERFISGFFQILRVIPSLALLILLIPVMGTGVKPAVTALTVLAFPPVILNTTAGFQQVPGFMVECAEGIGMTASQQLWKVRVPLALPLIFAGVRTALVEVVASATLAAKIGAGGLGEIIFTGLGLNRPALLLIGGILVAALSLLSGGIFDLITGRVLRYKA